MNESDSKKKSSDPPTPPKVRYAELELEEQLVIYDRQNHQAWIQSDAAVSADAMV